MARFQLKSHYPFVDKRPKDPNQCRVVLQVMMFREKTVVWKKFLVSLAMFTDFTLKSMKSTHQTGQGLQQAPQCPSDPK